MDPGMIRLAYHKPVDDKDLGCDIGSGNATEPGAFGRSGILRPLDALLSVDVRGNGLAFQEEVELGNHILRGLGERKTIGIIGGGSLHLVDAVFPEPVTGGVFSDSVFSRVIRM